MKEGVKPEQKTMNEFSEVLVYYGLCALRATVNDLCERFKKGIEVEKKHTPDDCIEVNRKCSECGDYFYSPREWNQQGMNYAYTCKRCGFKNPESIYKGAKNEQH